jgi:hypothetical protein
VQVELTKPPVINPDVVAGKFSFAAYPDLEIDLFADFCR